MTGRRSEPFILAMGIACLAYAVIGFGPGFVDGVSAGLHTIPLRIHLHGLVMMAWLGLLILQASLVWAGQMTFHRYAGRAGIVLFVIMYLMLIAFSLNNTVKPLPPPIEVMLNRIFAFQLFAIIATPVLLVLALRSLPDSESHRRYMLLITLVVIEAATMRMGFLPGIEGPDSNPFLLQLYPSLLLVPLVVFDVSVLGRVHRATLIGAGLICAGRLIGLALWYSPAWNELIHQFGEALKPVWPSILS